MSHEVSLLGRSPGEARHHATPSNPLEPVPIQNAKDACAAGSRPQSLADIGPETGPQTRPETMAAQSVPMGVRAIAAPKPDAATPSPAPALRHRDQARMAQAEARQLRLLVVDDSAMTRDIAAAFLLHCGHEVDCAEGGAEGVAAVAHGSYDVILMDLRMPEVDGFAATRCIRAIAGPSGQVRIVAMTAHTFAEQIAQCYEAGMVGHVAKPFTQASLNAAVVSASMGSVTAGQVAAGAWRERALAGGRCGAA
jgi:CheY-like chemotaxis protein